MGRREFRPRAAGGGSLRWRGAGRSGRRTWAVGRGRKLRSRVLIAGAVIVVAAVAWVGVQLLRPVPSMALTASATTVRVPPGAAPRPDWPGRAEAAVGLPGAGLLGTHGGSQPVPPGTMAIVGPAPGPARFAPDALAVVRVGDVRHGHRLPRRR